MKNYGLGDVVRAKIYSRFAGNTGLKLRPHHYNTNLS
jgi:hypothetical protein